MGCRVFSVDFNSLTENLPVSSKPSYPISAERMALFKASTNAVVFCLTSQNSLEVLDSLKDYQGKLFVISTLSPVYLEEAPWVESAMAVYGMGLDSFRAGFAVLAGDFEAEGVLPVQDLLPSLSASFR